jgi:hypothetical protein
LFTFLGNFLNIGAINFMQKIAKSMTGEFFLLPSFSAIVSVIHPLKDTA